MTQDAARSRGRLSAVLVVLVLLGLGTKVYSGPAADLIRGSAGGFFYVAFFTLLVLTIRPRASAVSVAAVVFLVTTGLEVLQLWHPAPLQRVRATLVGQTLIGGTFAWADIPFYAAGAFGAVALSSLTMRAPSPTGAHRPAGAGGGG